MAQDVSEFLNPKSMMTPGAAGALTMGITNVLCIQFAGLPGNWTALALSFVFGGLVVWSYTNALVPRLGYLFVNGLIIFMVAAGSNKVGKAHDDKARADQARTAVLETMKDRLNGHSISFAVATDDDVRGLLMPRSHAQSGKPSLWLAQQSPISPDDKRSRFFQEWTW